MKKYAYSLIVFVLALSTLFFVNPNRVKADAVTPTVTAMPNLPDLGFAQGMWKSGTAVDSDILPPSDWLQLLGTPVTVLEKGNLCLPFREAQFDWVGSIYQQSESGWVRLKTAVGWMTDSEGSIMACTIAPSAGTYALFAFYTGTGDVVAAPLPECTESLFSSPGYTASGPFTDNYPGVSVSYDYRFTLNYDSSLEGQTVTLQIIGVSPSGNPVFFFDGASLSLTTTRQKTLLFYETSTVAISETGVNDSFTLRVSTDACYQDLLIREIVD